MTRRRAFVSLLLAAVAPVVVSAQDVGGRGARAIDLAAARAVAGDSETVAAAKWRVTLARAPNDRLAALGLASLARLTFDSAADSALAALAAGSDAVARRAMLGRAWLLAARGRWMLADTLYRAVAVRGSADADSILESDALFASVALDLGRLNAAAARVDLARADSIRPPSDALLAAASGCSHAALNPSDSALRAATKRADLAGDPRLAAACLAPLPGFLFAKGQESAADTAASEVIARYRRTRDRSALANALMFRCYRRLTLSDYGRSAADCQEAVREGQAIGSLYAIGWAELNLGALSRLLGDASAARAHNTRARAALSALGDNGGLGILRRADADLAVDAGDTAAAHAAALDALRAARPGVETGAAWSRLANIALLEQRYEESRQDLDSGIAALTRGHAEIFIPAAKLNYGTILLREGRPAEALSVLQVSVYDTNQHSSRYLVSEQRAEALLALGEPARALSEMEQATDDLERWRRSLTDRELRVLAFQVSPGFGGPSPALADVVAAAVHRGWSERAFALAERRRARDLQDQRLRAQALSTPNVRAVAAPINPIVSLASLMRTVPDDSTALLEYVTGPRNAPTTVFVVTRRGSVARTLSPSDSLAGDIELFDDLIDQQHDAAAIAQSLGSRILSPAVTGLPAPIERLVIVADGPLHRAPFAALRLSKGVVVVDRYAVSLAPSATVMADLWSHPLPATNGVARVLAFGDPLPSSGVVRGAGNLRSATIGVVETRDVERAMETAGTDDAAPLETLSPSSAATQELPRLPWSADEARLAAAFGRASVVRVGADATPEVLSAAPLDSFAIVHFATHAVVDEQVPARSALVLSPAAGRSGLVDAGLLESYRMPVNLIVLSACRTARGALVEGEGLRGLANPLLGAGAHAVLATQWSVGDRAVVPLVYDIYRGLAAGAPAAEAVRRAEAADRRRGAPVREWAAFTVIGDPLVRIRLEAPAEASVPEWVREASKATAAVSEGR